MSRSVTLAGFVWCLANPNDGADTVPVMFRLAAAVLVSFAMLAAAAKGAPPTPARIGVTCVGVSGWARGGQVKPARVMLACGDANYWITALAWHGWGTATARATGRVHYNDCVPYCAAGRFHTIPAPPASRSSRRANARERRPATTPTCASFRSNAAGSRHRSTDAARSLLIRMRRSPDRLENGPRFCENDVGAGAVRANGIEGACVRGRVVRRELDLLPIGGPRRAIEDDLVVRRGYAVQAVPSASTTSISAPAYACVRSANARLRPSGDQETPNG